MARRLQSLHEKIDFLFNIRNSIFHVRRVHLGLFLIILAGLLLRSIFISVCSYDTSMWFVFYKTLASGHILDFYQIMGYQEEYDYPPIWLVYLLTLTLLSPTLSYSSFVVYVKIPIFLFEILTISILYSYIFQKTSSVKYASFSAGLFFLNPFVIKISTFQTMFDVIGCFFLLCAVCLLNGKRYGWAGIITGLALMTKQYLYFAFPLLVAVMIKQVHWKNLLQYIAGTFFPIAVVSAPFYITTPKRYLNIVLCRWGLAKPSSIRGGWTTSWSSLSGVWYVVRYIAKLGGVRIEVGDYYNYLNVIIALYCLTFLAYLIQHRFKILPDYTKVALTASALFILTGLSINPQYLILPIVFSCAMITSRRTLLFSILPIVLIPYYLPIFFPQLFFPVSAITAGLISAWTIGVVTQTFLILKRV